MLDGKLAAFPAAVPGGVRSATETLIASRQNVEKALASLGEERKKTIVEKIDLFAGATKTAVSPADALKAKKELDTVRQTFDDQEEALSNWLYALTERLRELASASGPDVVAVLNAHVAALKLEQAKEQGDVENVASRIAEYEKLIALIEGGGSPVYPRGKRGKTASITDE